MEVSTVHPNQGGCGQSQGQGGTGKGEVVKEARLASPFASVCLFSEPRAEKGGEWGVWVWLFFSGFLQMMSGFLGTVHGTLLEASFQEGPCLEGWQGALGGGLGVERAGWDWENWDTSS